MKIATINCCKYINTYFKKLKLIEKLFGTRLASYEVNGK